MRSVTIIALLITLSVASALNLRGLFGKRKNSHNLPVALFHGIGDSCSNGGTQHLVNLFADNLQTYAVCIESGSDIMSIMTSIEQQGKTACEAIKKNPGLQGEFSVVGVSQGSLVARYVLQKCQMKGTVKRYIGIGGPQMGVAGIPNCPLDTFPCNIIDKIVDNVYYWDLVQQIVGPAGYYKDPTNFDRYLKHSIFLADLNNERAEKNQTYVERWKNVDKALIIKFDQDMMIQPKETAHFEFLDASGKLVPLEQSDFYKSDYLGIRYLDENKKLEKVTFSGGHLHFGDYEVINVMVPALSS